jgi:hypothetical protein
MYVPAPLVIALALLGAVLIATAITGTAAWYGLYASREEERRRLMRGTWHCDECGLTMRFVGETLSPEDTDA